ncbi:MAG: VOC family protein [Ignavibacteriales bacterium]
MKYFYSIILILSLFITGCIRRTDQPLKRKIHPKTAQQENVNFKKLIPNLMVLDVNKTLKFYSDAFGFEPVVTLPDTGNFNFAIVTNGDVELMFQKRESLNDDMGLFKGAQPGGTFILSFEVKDIVQVYEKASAHAEMVRELHQTFYGTKEFAVKDNNGYILIFSEAMKR